MDRHKWARRSSQYLQVLSPATPEKLSEVGRILGLDERTRVIDWGCGYGEALRLWGEQFGIRGVGLDIQEFFCERGNEQLAQAGLAGQIRLICGDATAHPLEPGNYDVAVCLGSTGIWGGFRPAIRRMKASLASGGRVVVGEAFYVPEPIPQELIDYEGALHTEYELWQIALEEGFELECIVRAREADWDRYVCSGWMGMLRWLEEHPDHAEREEGLRRLHSSQEMYLKHRRRYERWAIYVLNPLTL
jgi:SAM-dependent methyltransferase